MTTPPFHASVLPLRYVSSVDSMRHFYLDRLGFEHLMGLVSDDGALDFAIVQLDGAALMLARPENPEAITRGPLEIYIVVKDVDAYHARLQATGVRVARPLQTQWWGDRNFAVEDPAGHLIWFSQRVGEMHPPKGIKVT